jgi:enoyl-[acyl-carrier-protein] reductase (NADH)
MLDIPTLDLAGAKGVVIGIANDSSIAYGCARAFRSLGADLAVTYLNEKARRFEDVGITTAILATHAGRMLTGATTYVDGGYHVMG